MGSFETFWKTVDAMRSTFDLITSQRPPSDTELDELEERLSVAFPIEYREFAGRTGAFILEAKQEFWPAPKPGDSGLSWSFRRALHVFGVGPDVPGFLDLVQVTTQFREDSEEPDLVPFAGVQGSVDRFCFENDGSIVAWFHADNAIEPVGGNFYDVLIAEAEQLQINMERYLRGEHRL